MNVSWHEENCPQNFEATSIRTAEVLKRTVDLDEVHGAITADIPVHVWLAGLDPMMTFHINTRTGASHALHERSVFLCASTQ